MVMGWDVSGDQYMSLYNYVELDAPSPPSAAHALLVALIHELAQIAKTQPHAAYSAFTHGLASKWTYFLRTIPDIAHLLQPLEDAIRHKFIPALTGRNGFSDDERELFSLPARLGGLGLTNPVESCSQEFAASVKVTAPLAALILLQQPDLTQTPSTINIVQRPQQEKTDGWPNPTRPLS